MEFAFSQIPSFIRSAILTVLFLFSIQAHGQPSHNPLPAASHQLKMGNEDTALQTLGIPTVLDQEPDRRQISIHLLFGILHVRQGTGVEALPSLAYISQWENPLSDYVNYYHAMALIQADKPLEALPILTSLREDPGSQMRQAAAFAHGDALFASKRYWDAIREYELLLKTFQFWPREGHVQLQLALSHEHTGKMTKAAGIYQLVVHSSYPKEVLQSAENALIRLEAGGVSPPSLLPIDRLKIGRTLGKRRQWKPAMEWLSALETDLRAAGVTPDILREVREETAGVLMRSNRLPEALVAYRKLWAEEETNSVAKGLARTLQRLGLLEEAAKIHQRRTEIGITQNRVFSDIADMYFREAKYKKALQFESQITRESLSHQWRLAWLHFQSGQETQAIALFAPLGRDNPKIRNKARYWHARALYRLGKTEEATAIYQRIARNAPLDYYGLQSENRLYENGDIPLSFARMPAKDWPVTSNGRAILHWPQSRSRELPEDVRTNPGTEYPETLLRTLSNQHGDRLPSLKKAFWLLQMGLVDESRQELRHSHALIRDMKDGIAPSRRMNQLPRIGMDGRKARLQTDRWGGPRKATRLFNAEETKQLSSDLLYLRRVADTLQPGIHKLLAGYGFVSTSSLAAQQKMGRPTQKGPARERNKWKSVFPLPYQDILIPAAANKDLDPLFLWTLMRIESRYDPLAISRSNAKGLIQILPRTGRLIAERIEDGGFVVDALHEPKTNIQYSAWYLHELMAKFQQQAPLAICSYNAGPFNVDRWLTRKGGLPTDEFIEEVPSTQAREYTKKALGVLLTYRWIYYGIENLYLPNQIDINTENNIDF